MVSSAPDRNKVFISYSHKDAKYLDGLLPHLKYLEKNKLIDFWVDTKIKPGEEWQDEIEKVLAFAKVAILLISVDFLISPFIVENELPPLLFAAEFEGMTILPVILRPCTLPKSLSRLQAINSLSRPLSRMKGYEREELWVKVANATVDAMSPRTSEVNPPKNSQLYTPEEGKKVVEMKVHNGDLSKQEADDADELAEALREMEQGLSLDPTWVLSKQNKIGEREEHG